jgi:hypothetical protein
MLRVEKLFRTFGSPLPTTVPPTTLPMTGVDAEAATWLNGSPLDA